MLQRTKEERKEHETNPIATPTLYLQKRILLIGHIDKIESTFCISKVKSAKRSSYWLACDNVRHPPSKSPGQFWNQGEMAETGGQKNNHYYWFLLGFGEIDVEELETLPEGRKPRTHALHASIAWRRDTWETAAVDDIYTLHGRTRQGLWGDGVAQLVEERRTQDSLTRGSRPIRRTRKTCD